MLSYYTRKSDVEFRSQLKIVQGCTVTLEVAGNENKDLDQSSHSQHDAPDYSLSHINPDQHKYIIKLNWPMTSLSSEEETAHLDEQDPNTENYVSDNDDDVNALVSKKERGKTKKRIIQGSKYAAAGTAAITLGILTAGIGLAAGLTFVAVSAAAGGGGVVATRTISRSKRKDEYRSLLLACTDFSESQKWKEVIESLIYRINDRSTGFSTVLETKAYDQIVHTLQSGFNTSEVQQPLHISSQGRYYKKVSKKSNWAPLDGGWVTFFGFGGHGLRICAEELPSEDGLRSRRNISNRLFNRHEMSVLGSPCPVLKSQVVLNASTFDAFLCLMQHGLVKSFDCGMGNYRSTFRVIEKFDDNMDIIHVVFRPLYLFPSWTAPRDFVLCRYWRYEAESEGSFVVCYDSIAHRECPPMPGYVRGEMHRVYMISPKKRSECKSRKDPRSDNQCLMMQMVQVDPRGWIPTTKLSILGGQTFADGFSVASLMQMVDVRDLLDHNRFNNDRFASDSQSIFSYSQTAQLARTINNEVSNATLLHDDEIIKQTEDFHDQTDIDDDISVEERALRRTVISNGSDHNEGGNDEVENIESYPPPYRMNMWAEPDSKVFRVRGANYLNDKKKINAGDSMFRLIAVDLVETSQNIMSGMCTHPKERVARALAREAKGARGDMPPFVFVLNIAIPGPPFLHLIIYYAVENIDTINGKAGTPFSKLANKFFFGDDDEFRDNTFKLIPRIVEGNFIVRKAVGSTPAIMGRKLKQYYMRSDRYLEIILDIGSSSVAAGVIRLASGYAKTLIVDMGFVLEGKEESVLPEKIMGSCRLKNVSFDNLRVVNLPDEE